MARPNFSQKHTAHSITPLACLLPIVHLRAVSVYSGGCYFVMSHLPKPCSRPKCQSFLVQFWCSQTHCMGNRGQNGHSVRSAATQPHALQAVLHCMFSRLSIIGVLSFLSFYCSSMCLVQTVLHSPLTSVTLSQSCSHHISVLKILTLPHVPAIYIGDREMCSIMSYSCIVTPKHFKTCHL